jgi:hypothetical protein
VRWLIAIAVLAVLLTVVYLGMGANSRAKIAEGRVQILTVERDAAAERAQADSAALDSVQAVAAQAEAALEAERAQARQRAIRASQAARVAQGEVRALLASQGASTASLDRLEAAHQAEVLSVRSEVGISDSLVATVRNQLRATERALESERAARVAEMAVGQALTEQVQALQRANRWGRIKQGGLGIGIIVLAVVALR